MAFKGKEASRGEMRRRHEAIIRSGALRGLRSEGRMVFVLALCWADYKTCQFRMSIRGAATTAGVQPNSVRRGLAQLLELGVIQAGPSQPGKRQLYRFRPPENSGDESLPGGSPAVTAPRSHTVTTPVTTRVRRAHEPCTEGSRAVTGAHTGCDPYSSIVLKDSSRILEGTSALTGRTGPAGPAGQSDLDRDHGDFT
jgi:hypothetical protein